MNINEFYNLIGENIKNIRKEHGDTQNSLAKKLNMSRGYISQIESSIVQTGISLDMLFKISKLYKIDIKDFFDNFRL